MSISTIEQEKLGQSLTAVERAVVGFAAVVFTVGNAVLGATLLLFLYVLVTFVL